MIIRKKIVKWCDNNVDKNVEVLFIADYYSEVVLVWIKSIDRVATNVSLSNSLTFPGIP